MKLIIDTKAIEYNIRKAKTLCHADISLMFKDFYDYMFPYVNTSLAKSCYGLNLKGSICYSINKATPINKGALVISLLDAKRCIEECNIKELYIPVNARDNREGLSIQDAINLSKKIKDIEDVPLTVMITSGCLNEKHPTREELDEIWSYTKKEFKSISLGGSYWLGKDAPLPEYVSELRIGEYMLFGTIPYNNEFVKKGKLGIIVNTEVIGVYPERKQILLDCGYSMADMDKSVCCDSRLKYIDSSSEYTIMHTDTPNCFRLGDIVDFIPNYKSLVKLRNVRRDFK